mmetsp:Transcript_2453/g.3496  ORF Transcript_2453/g.3496 Transcript_2453/m.3496 type:complete len:84 (-) Transcript_2453:486-737(-)
MRDSARVVDIPRECIASLARNSRMLERRTARPSAPRQKGVGPAPLSCNSYLDIAVVGDDEDDCVCVCGTCMATSPMEIARPSP